jgi:hypothetical protein
MLGRKMEAISCGCIMGPGNGKSAFVSLRRRSNEISQDVYESHSASSPALIAEDGVDLRRISEISGAISELIN